MGRKLDYMIEYIGNYKDWIDPKWIKEALNLEGYKVPLDLFNNNMVSREEALGIRQAMDPTERAIYDVYGTDRIFFHLLESKFFSFQINPPWVDKNKKITWWMTKMYPGQYIPVHQDVIKKNDFNSKRYWMPMLDWEPGHIFTYQDEAITNYKAGDVFVYDDLKAWHGAINIGSKVRLLLQVTTYEDKNEKSM